MYVYHLQTSSLLESITSVTTSGLGECEVFWLHMFMNGFTFIRCSNAIFFTRFFSGGLLSYSPRCCKWLRLSARMLSLPFMFWKVMRGEIEKISKAQFCVRTFLVLFLISFWSGTWSDQMTTFALHEGKMPFCKMTSIWAYAPLTSVLQLIWIEVNVPN